jgi:L-malate glycosyltransferase
MLGANPGYVVSQGEIVAEALERQGFDVRLTSREVNRWFRLWDMVRSLLSWSRALDIVVVLVYSGYAFAAADITSWVAKRLLHKPLVLALHGGNLPESARRYPSWTRRVLARADVLVAPSDYLARTIEDVGFAVRVIPNALPLESYAHRQRDKVGPYLLWMRTFHDVYRPDMAVEVLRLLLHSYPEARLTLAGQDRGLLDQVRHLVTKQGLQDSVRFAGFLDSSGKTREFQSHDIFINTSRVDNMPVSLVEAAAAGLAIVSTSVGGIPTTFRHERDALLVPDGDAGAMAQAVTRLIDDSNLATRLSRNGRLLGESCAPSEIGQDWAELFDGLLTCV